MHALVDLDLKTRGPVNNTAMQPSLFNIRVPLPDRDEVFLMNTLTDAQLVVSPDVARLLDRADAGDSGSNALFNPEEIQARLEKFRYLGYVPEADIAPLTAAATLFVYPSLTKASAFP